MDAQIGSAMSFRERICRGRADEGDLEEMLEYVTRSSLEIRCVAVVIPNRVADVIFPVLKLGVVVGIAYTFFNLFTRSM